MTETKISSDSNALRSIGKHFLVYSAAESIAKVIGFVMLPVYAHYLQTEGYGIIGIIDVVVSVMLLLIGQGLGVAMTRLYYQRETAGQRKVLICTSLVVMFFLVLAVSLPALLLSRQIAWLSFGDKGFSNYIVLAVLTFIFGMLGRNASGFILIQQKSVLFSIISLFKLVFGLSLNIYFIVYLELGVLGYLYSGLISAIIFALIFCTYTLTQVGLHFSKDDAKGLLSYNLPMIPGFAAMFIRNAADRVILRIFLGLSQVGIYEMLFKFATLIGIIIVQPLSKIFNVKRFEIADSAAGPVTLARFFTLQFSFMLFFGLVLSLEIPIILKVLTPEEFWLEGLVVVLAVLTRIINACYEHFVFGLLYAKETFKISIINIVIAVVHLIFALLLIKPFGILGAVIASCFSTTFQCILSYKMATPYYKIPFEWRRLLGIFTFGALLFLLINQIALVEHEGFSNWLIGTFSEPIGIIFNFLHLDSIKNGKLLTYTLSNIPLLIEGWVKLFFCFIFVGGLIYANIIPRRIFVQIFKQRSLKAIEFK